MSNFEEFKKIYLKDIKDLRKKINYLTEKFEEISYEHELLLEDIRVLDIRVIKLENNNVINNKDNIPNNNNNNKGQLFRSQISKNSKRKKVENINEENPVERQNIFVNLESKIDQQEENKESKQKGRKQRVKNSNTDKNLVKRQNKENSIFQNELNKNNIIKDNNEIINDNNINSDNNEIIDDNSKYNINSNFDIVSFGKNDFDNNNSILSTSDKISVFSFKNQLIKNNNNIKSDNSPKIIENYIPIDLNKNKYITDQKNKNDYIYNNNFEETSLEDIISSNIIKSINEIKLIVTSLPSYNKFDGLPQFQGIFQSALDGDSAKKFHKFCDGEPNILVVIQSKNGCRFGGYTKIGFSSEGDTKLDDSAFLFSLDKMKIYRVKRKMKVIYCDDKYGPCFGINDYKDLQINDNYLSQNSYVGRANGPFLNMNQDYELNQGSKEFQVDKLEIFKILI